MTINY
jgi:glycerol-3-phosphate O-acyltransferase